MTTSQDQARALDLHPRAIVEATAARDTFRALLGGELHSLAVGWPVFVDTMPARAPEVAIELTSGSQSAFELALMIPNESAARWVDRALGGNGESGLATRSGRLSEGECGVLAYLASRACRELGPYQVCDVAPARPLEHCVLWPMTLEGAFGRVAFRCAIAAWRAEAVRELHRVEVSVFDRAPATFRAGEVWISDRWNLSSTCDGLAGEVQLSVDGCASPLAAIVGAGQLRAHGPSARRDQVELVLASRAVSFAELARIAAGQPFPLTLDAPVELRVDGQTAARGTLISWRGAIGVRIDEA